MKPLPWAPGAPGPLRPMGPKRPMGPLRPMGPKRPWALGSMGPHPGLHGAPTLGPHGNLVPSPAMNEHPIRDTKTIVVPIESL